MTTITLAYLAIPVLAIELILMTYVVVLQPKVWRNRLLAGYLLFLAMGVTGFLLVGTAPTSRIQQFGAWLQLLSEFYTAVFIGLVMFAIFFPQYLNTKRLYPAWGVMAVITAFMVADWVLNTQFLFQPPPVITFPVTLSQVVADGGARFIYWMFLWLAHLLMLVLLVGLIVRLIRRRPSRQTFILMALAVSALVVANVWVTAVVPGALSLMGSLSAVLLVAWLLRDDLFSPVMVGLQQVMDTAVFGVLLFDHAANLLDFNQTAVQMLPNLPSVGTPLSTILQANFGSSTPTPELESFAHSPEQNFPRFLNVQQNPDNPDAPILYYQLRLATIKNAHTAALGYICTIDNQTPHKVTEQQITATAHALERYVYQLSLLNDIMRTADLDMDEKAMVRIFVDRFSELFLADNCFITFWDEFNQKPIPIAAYGPLKSYYTSELDVPFDRPTITHAVLETGQPVLLPDVRNSIYSYFYEQSPHFNSHSMIGYPIINQQEKIGAVILGFHQPYISTYEDIAFGEQLAHQIGIVISRKRLFQAEREQRKLAETLREIGGILTSTLDPENVFDQLLDLIYRVVPYDSANITEVRNGQACLVRARGYEPFIGDKLEQLFQATFDLNDIPTYQYMWHTKQPLILADVSTSPLWIYTEFSEHIVSWAGIPLIINNEVTAFLSVDHTQPNFYSLEHVNRLRAFAEQAALALQQARLFDESMQLYAETQRQAQQMRTLHLLSAAMVGVFDERTLTDLVVTHLHEQFGYSNVSVFMMDHAAQELVLQSIAGVYAHFKPESGEIRQSVAMGVMGRTAVTGETLLINDTSKDPYFFQHEGMLVEAELIVPIKSQYQLLGLLNIDSLQKDSFDNSDSALLTIVADQLSVAIEKARLMEMRAQRVRELELVSQVSASLRAAHTREEMLPVIVRNVNRAMSGLATALYLISSDDGAVTLTAVYPDEPDFFPLFQQFPPTHLHHVIQTKSLWVANSRQLYGDQAGNIYLHVPIESFALLPLQSEDIVIGVLLVAFANTGKLITAEIRLLTSIADIAANALQRAQLVETLEDRVAKRTHELNRAYMELQELDQLKSKFIADVSHELRTPVANLKLYLDLLDVGKPEKRSRYLEIIRQQTTRLTQLVETTITLPELDAYHEAHQFQAVDFAAIVQEILAQYQTRIKMSGLQLVVQIADDLPPVWGDATYLSRIVQNLLSNAVNYTETGQIEIRLVGNLADLHVTLWITDTGFGIEPAEIPLIYDRFYRGKRVGQSNIPGMGVGLAVVKELVQLHNGRIQISSVPQEGTVCMLKLPTVASIALPAP
jgi:signal transduction histidine kinase/putative methionine-R-sulfoxide reductase with GAF domain